MLRRHLLAIALPMMLPAALPSTASAGSFTYYGPHLGIGQGPDQFVVGGQMQWNGVAPRIAFVPGIDFGLGNDNTLVELNGDFHYQLATSTGWQPYLGGGIGLDFVSGGTGTGDNSTAGGHLIVGAAVPNGAGGRFFTEVKLGFGDTTDLKVMAGWNLRTR
jgi:hypothetical protein